MMNWVLSDTPIHKHLFIFKWKWYIRNQSQIGPKCIRKHRNSGPDPLLHQCLSLRVDFPRISWCKTKTLVLFHGWVSSVCCCKLKIDCCCTTALLSGSKRWWWIKSSQWTVLSGQRVDPGVRLQSDLGAVVNGLASWSKAYKVQD